MKQNRFPEVLLGAFLVIAFWAVWHAFSLLPTGYPSSVVGPSSVAQPHSVHSLFQAYFSKITEEPVVLFTLVLALASIFQNMLLLKSNRTSAQNASTAATTLEVTNRPWVHMAEVQIASPLQRNERGDVTITFQYRLTNTGRSPAINVWIEGRFFPMGPHRFAANELREVRSAVLAAPESEQRLNLGITLFPGDIVPLSVTYTINNDQLDRHVQSFAGVLPDGQDIDFYHPHLVGCVAYRFAFQAGWHCTDFAFQLSKNGTEAFSLSDANVSPGQMTLGWSVIGGSRAN